MCVYVRVFVLLSLFWKINKTNDSVGLSITHIYLTFENKLTVPADVGADASTSIVLRSVHMQHNGCHLTDRKYANSSNQMGDKNSVCTEIEFISRMGSQSARPLKAERLNYIFISIRVICLWCIFLLI